MGEGGLIERGIITKSDRKRGWGLIRVGEGGRGGLNRAFTVSIVVLVSNSVDPRPIPAMRVNRGGLDSSTRRIFPTSLIGDVTSELGEDNRERG